MTKGRWAPHKQPRDTAVIDPSGKYVTLAIILHSFTKIYRGGGGGGGGGGARPAQKGALLETV